MELVRNLQTVDVVQNKESIRLVWLDGNIDDSADSLHTQKLLLDFNPAAQFYTDKIRCINVIKCMKQEQVLLIISGALAREVLPEIHGLRFLIAVFIFCRNRDYHIKIMSEYSKIIDVFTVQEKMLAVLQGTMEIVEKQICTFSLFDQKQKSTRQLSKDAASFMWHQLLLYVLKKMPQDEHAKEEMLTTCTHYYAMNKKELRKIEQFRRSYSREQAIQWYTDECFLYKLLNKAIRTEDIELLYSFRFYIIDLCDALKQESEKIKKTSLLTVYRGQQISNEELEKLRKNVGTLISTNGFLSTSRSIKVALGFISQLRPIDNMQHCLFEISADPAINGVIFADIEKYSKIKEEQEVLFGLNATFKIESVKMDSTLKVWKICLKTSFEGAARVDEYVKLKDEEMELVNPLICFGRIMQYELGQLDRAEAYFKRLLQSLPKNHPDMHFVYNGLGNVYREKNELCSALEHYQEAYRIRCATLASNHTCIASSLHNIGLAYKDKGDFDQALTYLGKCLAIQEKNSPDPHPVKALALLNIGSVYESKRDFNKALSHYNNGLDIYLKFRPAIHPDIACCYGFLGSVYENQKNFDQALHFYERRLAIEEECLPADHPNLFKHFDRLANLYAKTKGKDMALSFCEQKLIAHKGTLGETHNRIASVLMTMGDVSKNQKPHYENALSILEKSVPTDERLMVDCLAMLGAVALDEKRFEIGISYWKRVLDLNRQIHSPTHPEIATSLSRLGDAYYLTNINYQEAIEYYLESLAIYRKSYVDHHRTVLELRELIGDVYDTSGKVSEALKYYELVLKLRQRHCPADADLSELKKKIEHLRKRLKN